MGRLVRFVVVVVVAATGSCSMDRGLIQAQTFLFQCGRPTSRAARQAQIVAGGQGQLARLLIGQGALFHEDVFQGTNHDE